MSDDSDTSSIEDFEKEYNEIYDEMKTVFEEFKILEQSKKKIHEFDFQQLIEYKNTEKEEKDFVLPFLNHLLEVDTLETDLSLKECYIIPYFLCTDAILPFLIFFFHKNISQELSFFSYLHNSSSIEENISVLLNTYFKEEDLEIKGYHCQEDKYYFYVELKTYQSPLISNYSKAVPILLDELVNSQVYLNDPIPSHLVHYFYDNIDMLVLKKDDLAIEIPSVVYTNHDMKKCEFYSVFGIPKSNLIFDNQYTFFSLEEILEKQTTEKNGVNRNVIFCGKQHYVTMEEFTEEELLNKDSLFVYNHILYKYIWIIKEYQQQYPISYHYVKDLLR